MMKKYWWVFLLASPGLALIMAGLLAYYMLNIWTYQGSTQYFEIKRGEGFSHINARLYKKKLIKSPKVFHRYAQVNDLMTKFKAGRYEIKKGSTMIDIFHTLIKGKGITQSVTIPEGKNLFEIGKILEEKKIIKDAQEFIRLAQSPSFIQSLGLQGKTIEGYLYPETYHLTPQSSSKNIIKMMVKVFNDKTKDLNFAKAPLGLSKREVITLASIVEKETGAPFERPLIAGVFINRLQKRMRLQSDPTTIYGIYERFDGNLRKKDLLKKTPYNTYKIPALPIGPISNPALSSLKAVLNPNKNNYLYFVSQNDGTHIFSESYAKHNQAVKKFQLNRKARQGKSWRDLKK